MWVLQSGALQHQGTKLLPNGCYSSIVFQSSLIGLDSCQTLEEQLTLTMRLVLKSSELKFLFEILVWLT